MKVSFRGMLVLGCPSRGYVDIDCRTRLCLIFTCLLCDLCKGFASEVVISDLEVLFVGGIFHRAVSESDATVEEVS